MTATAGSEVTDTALCGLVAGRWIDHWEPEDEAFWQGTGRRIANRNPHLPT